MTVIDGKGKTLIPGLIDAHWHTNYANTPANTLIVGDMSEVAIRGFLGAEDTLMRGFTSVRDMGAILLVLRK
ncbi:amidohydrolase family protein [Shewanella colwelliana]|uniref:amidohydrolase family protein n=1 Tax=Shewanella colwelliana TaxID=23 RepID=UPI001B7F9264